MFIQRDVEGNTPLHYAVFGDNLKNVEVLVKKGADVAIDVKNEDKLTPLQLANNQGSRDISAYLRSKNKVKLELPDGGRGMNPEMLIWTVEEYFQSEHCVKIDGKKRTLTLNFESLTMKKEKTKNKRVSVKEEEEKKSLNSDIEMGEIEKNGEAQVRRQYKNFLLFPA